MTFKAYEISNQLLEDTHKSWELLLGTDEFTTEYGALFEWIQNHRDYTVGVGKSCVYALVENGHKVASAFLEIVNNKDRGGLTKLLKVIITPQYWNVGIHQDQVIRIFVDAIMQSIEISNTKLARTIKIYGRSDSMLSLLHSIHVQMSDELKQNTAIKVSMKGRWLEISC